MPTSQVLVLAPHGRDAIIVRNLLLEAGVGSLICTGMQDFTNRLTDDTLLAIVSEEAIQSSDSSGLSERLAAQPAWSDLPVVIFTHRGGGLERNPIAARLSETLGNITFLERPFHPTTFISVVRTALRGRQRQFDVRAYIEDLREGEERLKTALRAGHLGSWELDVRTMRLQASAAFKALFGRGPEEDLSYADLIAAIHREDRDRVIRRVRRSVDTGADFALEGRLFRPDGTLRWAEIRARLVADRLGQRARLVGVSADITDRRHAQEVLREANEGLEERVRERTLELEQAHAAVLAQVAQRERAEEQLRQAQKMELIGQLTGGVAHDFNNLLTAVLSNLELLRKHVGEDERGHRLIDGAIQGARRGASLTQRLLAFARRQDLKVEPSDPVSLIRNMKDLLERSVGSRIEMRFDLPQSLPMALLDTNQVELALLNLVVNARDAMPEGGTVTISADMAPAEPDQPAYVRLTVTDTGHGMDASTLEKATEPFFSTKELGKGTGLGLSMIQGLASQLNGSLRLSSSVGIGTRAELWLPATDLAAADVPAAERRQTEPGLPPAPAPSGAGARLAILVVDDDILISMSTVDMLEDLGHQVVAAESGARALEILRQDTKIDLMITDFSMPRMNGEQLSVAARQLRPDLPILLATGYAELQAGSEIDLPRLAKPYQQAQLAAAIGRLVAGGDQTAPQPVIRTMSSPS